MQCTSITKGKEVYEETESRQSGTEVNYLIDRTTPEMEYSFFCPVKNMLLILLRGEAR